MGTHAVCINSSLKPVLGRAPSFGSEGRGEACSGKAPSGSRACRSCSAAFRCRVSLLLGTGPTCRRNGPRAKLEQAEGKIGGRDSGHLVEVAASLWQSGSGMPQSHFLPSLLWLQAPAGMSLTFALPRPGRRFDGVSLYVLQ